LTRGLRRGRVGRDPAPLRGAGRAAARCRQRRTVAGRLVAPRLFALRGCVAGELRIHVRHGGPGTRECPIEVWRGDRTQGPGAAHAAAEAARRARVLAAWPGGDDATLPQPGGAVPGGECAPLRRAVAT